MSKKIMLLLLTLFSTLFNFATFAAGDIKVYSTIKADAIQPQLDRFTQASGIEVELVVAETEALLKRLQTETDTTAADIFIGASVNEMYRAKQAGLLQPVTSEALTLAVPPGYRDGESFWYGLSMVVRPIVFVKSKVDPFEFYGYEEMVRPEWKGRICVSTADNIFNQSLIASMIASRGKEATQKWLAGFIENLARPPQGSDRDQLVAISEAKCDLTLANTSLYGQLRASKEKADQQLVDGLSLIWANQPGRGVHANFTAAGVTANAPQQKNALKLLEFLFTEESQRWFSNHNSEYPVRDMTWPDALVKWGRFKGDSMNMPKLGALNATAVSLMKQAGWQ